MDLKIFRDNFHLLADTPNGIPKLREMILQLAVMGKLVPQDPNDEPANVLREIIGKEKARLIKEGRMKKQKALSEIEKDEKPFSLPEGWIWVRLGEIGDTNIGLTYSPKDISDDGIPVLRANNILNGKLVFKDLVRVNVNPPEKVIVNVGDLLICARSGSQALVGKTAIIHQLNEKTAFGAFMAIFRSRLNNYIYYFINSPLFRQVIDNVNTTTINQITQSNLRSTMVPIPPLAEQQRIVAKVDEFMALCDQLEEQKTKREKLHAKMNKTCLYELTSPEPIESRKGWTRIRNNFDLLYDTPGSVAELRQSILQLAVMGKLVPQDPKDEHAAVQLGKIAQEKERFIAQGKIKKPKPLPAVEPNEVPYILPKGWIWTRLGGLIRVSSGKALPKRIMRDGSIPVFGGNGMVGYHDTWNVESPTVVIGRVGFYCGSVHVTPEKAWITDNAFITAFSEKHIFRPFLVWLLKATDLQQNDSATAQPVISGSKIYPITVGLPPFSEQKRIVKKLDRLMAIYDNLKTELSQSHILGEELMSAIISALIIQPTT